MNLTVHAIIVGASLIGRKLAQMLAEHGHDVVVVDTDRARCEDVRAESGALVINGDPARLAVLEEAGIKGTDVLVAALDSDPENLAICMVAKRYSVPKIVAKLEEPDYEEVFTLAGTHHVVGAANILFNEMMIEIEQPSVRSVTTLAGGKVELMVVTIPEGSSIAGQRVADLAKGEDFPEGFLFVAVIREDQVRIAHGNTVIHGGDDVVVVATTEDVPLLEKIVGDG